GDLLQPLGPAADRADQPAQRRTRALALSLPAADTEHLSSLSHPRRSRSTRTKGGVHRNKHRCAESTKSVSMDTKALAPGRGLTNDGRNVDNSDEPTLQNC